MQLEPVCRGTPSQSREGAPIDSTSPRRIISAKTAGWGRVLLIDEIGKAQQLGLRIEEGDVEIARIHQLADDIVNGGEKLLQIFGRLATRRDGVQSRIQLLGALLLGDVAIGSVGSNSFA